MATVQPDAKAEYRKAFSALYGRRWRNARLEHLTQHPFCVFCEQQGMTRQATELDHIIPHKGNLELFWDESNWQGLCHDHHRGTKARMERSGYTGGCDVNGKPLHPNKFWR